MEILKSRRVWLLAVLVLLAAGLASIMGIANAAPAVTTVSAQLNPGYTIMVDGVKQNLFNSSGASVYPLVYNGTTYLPLRAMGELMNKNVNWDEANLTASLSGTRTAPAATGQLTRASQQYVSAQVRPDFTIMMDGQRRTFRNSDGSTIYPLLYNGSVYLPLRAIGELMGKNVDWDGNTQTISLYGGSATGGSTVTDADSFGSTTGNTGNSGNAGNTGNTGNNSNIGNTGNNGATGTMLTLEQARAAALRVVSGAVAGDITKIKLDYEDGRAIYEVEIFYNYTEYELELDAYSGATLKLEYESKNQGGGTQTQPGGQQPQVMTNDQAREAVLRAVPGASLNNITKLALEYDDGRWIFDAKVYYNFVTYELELDAYNGTVLDMQAERDDYGYYQAHRGNNQAVVQTMGTVYCADNCTLNHTHNYQAYCQQDCTLSHTHHYQTQTYCAQNCTLNHTHHYAKTGSHHSGHHR